MKTLLPAVSLLACALTGCGTVAPAQRSPATTAAQPPAATLPAAAVGQPVRSLLQAAGDLRIEFFDAYGKSVPDLPAGSRGSVSVHTRDGSGQDNYTFDAAGQVTRHLRSYGPNYAAGVWEEAK